MAESCSVNRCSAMYLLPFGLLTILAILKPAGAAVGVCYGTHGNNLPTSTEVVQLYRQKGIPRMRIYGVNDAIFQALANSGIQLVLDIPNEDLQYVSTQANADLWVQNYVKKYSSTVTFRYIAVGNEVRPTDSSAQYLYPAVLNIYNAIVNAGLSSIKVTTATFMDALAVSYPPSSGSFRSDYQQLLGPVINFLKNTQAPILVNTHPYLAYIRNPTDIRLDYALFTAPSTVVYDGPFQYQNLFDAMVDSFYSALEKIGAGSLRIVVSESGWPSAGGLATTVNNARTYNTKLYEHVNIGTPKRPGWMEIYLFAMFDENLKSPEYEKHWGLFYPNKMAKYSITLS